MAGIDPGGQPSLLESGASATIPSRATGGPASNPAQVQQILQLLSNRGGASGMSGPSTTAQSAIPPYQPNKQQPVNAPQIPTGHFQSVGENKRATKQAMFNNIAAIANQAVSVHHERQVRDMSSMVTRIQGATEGKQQAEAMLKSDPNNQDAKAQLKKNSDILSDIFSDPSNAKKLQKAFNVPLLGDKGKATPEYLGLMKALKEKDADATKQAGGAMASRFQNQMPSTQQLSPQMQAQAAAVKAGVSPTANAQLAAQTKQTETIQKAADNMWNRESREAVSGMLVEAKDAATKASILKQVMANGGKMAVAQVLVQGGIKREQIKANAQMTDTKWRMAGNYLDVLARNEQGGKQVTGLKTEYGMLENQTKELQKRLDKASDWDLSLKGVMGAKTTVEDIKKQLDDLDKRKQQVIQRAGALNDGLGNSSTGSSSSDGSENKDGADTEFDKLFEEQSDELLKDQSPD